MFDWWFDRKLFLNFWLSLILNGNLNFNMWLLFNDLNFFVDLSSLFLLLVNWLLYDWDMNFSRDLWFDFNLNFYTFNMNWNSLFLYFNLNSLLLNFNLSDLLGFDLRNLLYFGLLNLRNNLLMLRLRNSVCLLMWYLLRNLLMSLYRLNNFWLNINWFTFININNLSL